MEEFLLRIYKNDAYAYRMVCPNSGICVRFIGGNSGERGGERLLPRYIMMGQAAQHTSRPFQRRKIGRVNKHVNKALSYMCTEI